MLLRRVYYALKPHLPWRLRIGMRRVLARRLRRTTADIWPIDPATTKQPEGWPGWPAGKKFAVDLFNSKAEFDRKAERINQYLRDWGAKGFCAGFMLGNLDWLHKLDISYDCSTFDTDPFEPQPDSTGTIFPFCVPGPGADDDGGARGYVELPYTLPQDSTLYVLHQEGSSNIWRDKLEWLASHGGMVLLNVHPDYLHIRGQGPSPQSAVLEHYLDLLRFLQARFPDAYWHALPHQVAAFVRNWRQGMATRSP